MTFSARVLAHSVARDIPPLISMEITFPRIILAEFNTHRMFSRNSASSRAIPVEKMLRMVRENPYIPSSWGKNQKGMQAEIDLDERDSSKARDIWLHARDKAVEQAEKLLDVGVHKQLTNRLLEPFMWHTVIVTATDWSNFFHLRDNKMAHPDIQRIASMMRAEIDKSTPAFREKGDDHGGWHLPLIQEEDLHFQRRALLGQRGDLTQAIGAAIETLIKISVGRCARVSYLTHDGKRDHDADIRLHDDLLKNGHMSPFEHVARPATVDDLRSSCASIPGDYRVAPALNQVYFGNLRGWVQYRKMVPNESDILAGGGA
jgi:thymidylate synthase ThyX